MKTNDLFKVHTTSKKLNENLNKTFGKKINFEAFSLEQLHDARNKLRTQMSQTRSSSGFNENLNSDTYYKTQMMLDAINVEIKQREDIQSSDSELEERSLGKKLATFGLGAAIGAGAMTGIDSIDMKHTELGKAVYAAAQQGDEYAQKHLKNLNFYADENPAMIQKLHNKYLNKDVTENVNLREGEIQKSSAIVTAKQMADRVGRWIEDLSGMENDTLLQLGDSIRDEMGLDYARNFIGQVAPSIQKSLEELKQTREAIATSIRYLTGEEQPAEMLGQSDANSSAPSISDEDKDIDDEFAAADAAVGGIESSGREQRESIEYQNNLLRVLAG